MSDRPTLVSRRTAMLGAVGATAALATGITGTTPAAATAPMLGAHGPTHQRFKLGDFEVTVIHDGFIALDGPHPIFG